MCGNLRVVIPFMYDDCRWAIDFWGLGISCMWDFLFMIHSVGGFDTVIHIV